MKRARVRTNCGIAKVGVRAYTDISDTVVRYLYPGDEFTFEPDDYKQRVVTRNLVVGNKNLREPVEYSIMLQHIKYEGKDYLIHPEAMEILDNNKNLRLEDK